MNILKSKLKHGEEIDFRDGSVYTGLAGIALVFLKAATAYPVKNQDYLREAVELANESLKRLSGRKVKLFFYHQHFCSLSLCLGEIVLFQ